MRIFLIYGYSVMVALTTVYCSLVWYAGSLFSVFLKVPVESQPLITKLFIAPLPLPFWFGMIHWQLLAVLSLIICTGWGYKRTRNSDSDNGLALPMATHTAWIVFAICCHMLGAVMPMVGIGHIIQ